MAFRLLTEITIDCSTIYQGKETLKTGRRYGGHRIYFEYVKHEMCSGNQMEMFEQLF